MSTRATSRRLAFTDQGTTGDPVVAMCPSKAKRLRSACSSPSIIEVLTPGLPMGSRRKKEDAWLAVGARKHEKAKACASHLRKQPRGTHGGRTAGFRDCDGESDRRHPLPAHGDWYKIVVLTKLWAVQVQQGKIHQPRKPTKRCAPPRIPRPWLVTTTRSLEEKQEWWTSNTGSIPCAEASGRASWLAANRQKSTSAAE